MSLPANQNSEQAARIQIDAQLSAAGWAIQDIATLNLHAARGVAVREMQSHGGPADYILFVDGKALGIVEAKKEGTNTSKSAPLTTDPVKTLTNLITLVRHTVDPQKTPLAPFPDLVNARFEKWLSQQQNPESGEAADSPLNTENLKLKTSRFTESQIRWLKVIRDYIALNGAFATDDQDAYLDAWQSVDSNEGVPLAVAKRGFGQDLKFFIEELNQSLDRVNLQRRKLFFNI